MKHKKHRHPGRGRRDRKHFKHKKSHWFSEFVTGRAPRIGRGETRFFILDTLLEGGRHGYDIIRSIQEKTAGMYRPSPGTVYPALHMLEEQALVSAVDEGDKKRYELTSSGREELDSGRSLLDDYYDHVARKESPDQEELFEELHEQLARILRAISRSFHRGELETEKVGQLRAVFENAVGNIEDILKK